MENQQLVVLVTAPTGDLPAQIAHALVSEGLAACVNILGPIRSVYFWDGAVQDEQELQLVIKTTADRYDELERRVRELHSYEVAEVIALKIERGAPDYLAWMTDMCHRS